MEIETKRLFWPDFCKGIAILLVVVGHAIGYVSSYGGGKDISVLLSIDKWIYSFHMPLFFFVSGFLQRISEDRKGMSRNIVKSKMISLIVPYVAFSIAFWAFKMFFGEIVNNPITIIDLLLIIIFPLSDLWFLYALFILFIIHVLLKKLRIDDRFIFVVALVLSILLSSMEWKSMWNRTAIPRICSNITYYETGLVLSNVIEKNDIFNKKHRMIISMIFVILGGLICFIDIQIPVMLGVKKVASAYCSIFGLYQLSQIVVVKPLQFLGSKSLYVYLTHDYAVCASVIALQRFFFFNYYLLTLITTIVGVVFSILVIRICTKNKMFDIVFKPNALIKI